MDERYGDIIVGAGGVAAACGLAREGRTIRVSSPVTALPVRVAGAAA